MIIIHNSGDWLREEMCHWDHYSQTVAIRYSMVHMTEGVPWVCSNYKLNAKFPADTLPSYTICPIEDRETVILEEVEGGPPQKVPKSDCQLRDSLNANNTDMEDNSQSDQLEEGINANKTDIEDDLPCLDKFKDDMTEIIWRALENMKCAHDNFDLLMFFNLVAENKFPLSNICF